MEVHELMEYDLGHTQIDTLDSSPPMSLLATLSERSGIGLGQLRCMSLSGWVPWLLDSLDDVHPSSLETYVFQFSVLLPRGKRKARKVTGWRAWIPSKPNQLACPVCMESVASRPLLLAWQLPLMLSCPLHGCWLEPCHCIPGYFLGWDRKDISPVMASTAVAAMDQRSWQAMTTGFVELPRRRIHAGVWFRLLRTLLDEINTPVSQCGSYGGMVRNIWEQCDYKLRAGQSHWFPYENLPLRVQRKMMEAAATAIVLIESKAITPSGEHADLFYPIPHNGFTNGLIPEKRQMELHSIWQGTVEAIKEALVEAKHNPEIACFLFALASYGRHNPEHLSSLREIFASEGIPPEFLSHYVPDGPFTCRRISDGINDNF